MGFTEAIASCFRKYATFRGRSPRSEYWYFTLFVALVDIAAKPLDALVAHSGFERDGPIAAMVGLALMLPHLSVFVRRLHDLDLSGWWAAGFLGAIAIAAISAYGSLWRFGLVLFVVAILAMLICLILKGTEGPNRFGSNPLEQETLGGAAT